MNEINGFTFFRSYHDGLKDLDRDDKRDILEAIDNYIFEDVIPEFDGFKKTIWTFLEPNLTSSKNKSKNAKKEIKKKSKKNQNKNNDLMNKDKNKDKGSGIEIEKEDNSSTTRRIIYEFIEENFGRPLSPIEYEKINTWKEDYSEDIIKYAVEKSVLANTKNFSYTNGILKNWKASGYKTLKEIKQNGNIRPREKLNESKEIFDYNWLEDAIDD